LTSWDICALFVSDRKQKKGCPAVKTHQATFIILNFPTETDKNNFKLSLVKAMQNRVDQRKQQVIARVRAMSAASQPTRANLGENSGARRLSHANPTITSFKRTSLPVIPQFKPFPPLGLVKDIG
jgi:hypothetical protein